MHIFANADPRDLWQPIILGVSLAIQLLYLLAVIGPGRHRFQDHRKVPMRQIICFLGSMWVMYFSFAGPLDYISDHYLFSAHMIQHMLEIMLMTPMVILGIPDWMFEALMRRQWSQSIIRGWSHPIIAGAVFNGVYAAFHSPLLYGLTLRSDQFHLLEHVIFFIIAFFMWLPAISPYPSLPRLTPGKRLLYLLYNYNLMMPVVILLLVARHPWYSFYAAAPRIIPGLSPMADMQWGAILMMVGSVIPYLVVGTRAYRVQNDSIWYD